MTLMTQQEMMETLEYKSALIRSFMMQSTADKTLEAFNFPERVAEIEQGDVIPDCFYESDETFDAEKCARMINDYEVEILSDLKDNPQAKLKLSGRCMELIQDSRVLKQYDVDFVHGFKWLIARELVKVEKMLGDRSMILSAVLPRADKIVIIAKKLQQQDVEEWELWRDMPSLYRCNDVDI